MVKLHILSSQIIELQYYYLDDDSVVIISHFYQNLLTNKDRNSSFEGNSPGSALQYLQAKYLDTIYSYFLERRCFYIFIDICAGYITAFERLYPGIFSRIYWATHDEGSHEIGTDLESIENWKPEIWELPENIHYWITTAGNTPSRWIVNLDLDYFFNSRDSAIYQLLTDEYIKNICKEIENSLNNIDVVTIALSPEFCGGWKYSFRIMDIISDHFSLGFEHTW